jgi:hypothetical protein
MGVVAIHGVIKYVMIHGMKIGDTIRVTSPTGVTTPHKIRNEVDLARFEELQADGYFVLGEVKKEFDFDLPEEKNGLKIHRARPEDCESCSS